MLQIRLNSASSAATPATLLSGRTLSLRSSCRSLLRCALICRLSGILSVRPRASERCYRRPAKSDDCRRLPFRYKTLPTTQAFHIVPP